MDLIGDTVHGVNFGTDLIGGEVDSTNLGTVGTK